MSVPHCSDVVNSFIRELALSAPQGSYLASGAKSLCRPAKPKGRPTGIDYVRWTPTPLAGVEHIARRVAATQDDFDYLSSFGPEYEWPAVACEHIADQRLPVETMTRLVVYRTSPEKAGTIKELRGNGAVLGFMADVDLARPGGQDYPPDLTDALDVLDDLSPTIVEQCGRSLPTAWILDRPCFDIDAADDLGRDLVAEVGDRCADHGWRFDSPVSLTAWLRVPGTWSVLRQCLVMIVGGTRQRLSMDELRELIPRHSRRRSYGGRYFATDDPWNVGLGSRSGTDSARPWWTNKGSSWWSGR
jgi:hypothetical protein